MSRIVQIFSTRFILLFWARCYASIQTLPWFSALLPKNFCGSNLNTTPSEKGSRLSTNSSSASPPSVIIWYISFSFFTITLSPVMNSPWRLVFRPLNSDFFSSLDDVILSSSSTRSIYCANFFLKATIEAKLGFMDLRADSLLSKSSFRALTFTLTSSSSLNVCSSHASQSSTLSRNPAI